MNGLLTCRTCRLSADEQYQDAKREVDWASIRCINDKSPEAETAYQSAYAAYRVAFDAIMLERQSL